MSDSIIVNIETPQSSKRKSQISKRYRVTSEEDRRNLKEKVISARLESLDDDNEQQPIGSRGDDEDNDYNDDENEVVYTTPVNKKRLFIAREKKKNEKKSMNLNFNDVLEKSYLETFPDHVPTYISVQSKPSIFPPRHFCSICGYIGAYTCKQCSSRYCSIKCFNYHNETRCKGSIYT
ncbi:hypothetical protein ACTFIW_007302 [Dictyostelium discoideum]